MGLETEVVEQRLKSFLVQLRTEFGILHRIVYKNKNQHRRSTYFQFLLKVRRDLRLLQSANLEDILNSCFLVINGNRPKQKLQLLESLKRKRSNGNKHNFLERLMGVARLLSQMVEPMLKAAMEISTLLAQSFFMGFSLTVLALLARFRVLIQQILLDVVCTYNTVSSLAQKKQAIKISEDRVQVFREYHPTKGQPSVLLECVWQTDKYVLIEKTNGSETQSQGKDIEEYVPSGVSAVHYHSIEVLLGDNEPETQNPNCAPEVPNSGNNDNVSSAGPCPESDEENQVKDRSPVSESPLPPSCSTVPEGGGTLEISSSPQHPNPVKRKRESKGKVAFVSVKVPGASSSRANTMSGLSIKSTEKVVGKMEGR